MGSNSSYIPTSAAHQNSKDYHLISIILSVQYYVHICTAICMIELLLFHEFPLNRTLLLVLYCCHCCPSGSKTYEYFFKCKSEEKTQPFWWAAHACTCCQLSIPIHTMCSGPDLLCMDDTVFSEQRQKNHNYIGIIINIQYPVSWHVDYPKKFSFS